MKTRAERLEQDRLYAERRAQAAPAAKRLRRLGIEAWPDDVGAVHLGYVSAARAEWIASIIEESGKVWHP